MNTQALTENINSDEQDRQRLIANVIFERLSFNWPDQYKNNIFYAAPKAYRQTDDDYARQTAARKTKRNRIKLEWINTLFDEIPGFTGEQASLGMERAKVRSPNFIPKVGEFLEFCKGQYQDFGMPDPDEAHDEAQRFANYKGHKWSHPGVELAAQKTGHYSLRTNNTTAGKARFMRNYAAVLEISRSGGDVRVNHPQALADPNHHKVGPNGNRKPISDEAREVRSFEAFKNLMTSTGIPCR